MKRYLSLSKEDACRLTITGVQGMNASKLFRSAFFSSGTVTVGRYPTVTAN